MGILARLRRKLHLRLQRRVFQLRAFWRSRELTAVVDRTGDIPEGPVLFSTVRNEALRLPWFLKHYRDLGIVHFCLVDNGSTDGTRKLLEREADVSLWSTEASYKASRFGVDWLNWLLSRHGSGRWVLVADPDELLVYPFCETRRLPALTRWLEDQGRESFGTLLLDMYGEGVVAETSCRADEDPVAAAPWFDAGNYFASRDSLYLNIWIQGGPRQRAFFADRPKMAPALNKVPLVRWQRGFVYKNGAHELLPRRLNKTFGRDGTSMTSGVLLHVKFLDVLAAKVEEELDRREHYGDSQEYLSYADKGAGVRLWTPHSTRYEGWQQLCDLGLMARGGWL